MGWLFGNTPTKSKPRFAGVDIKEVWDWRLSTGNPILYCDGDTWVIRIWANKSPDGESTLLQEIETEIPSTGGLHDHAAIGKCYETLYVIRDNFSRENIDILKPLVAKINSVNKKLAEAYAEGDV